MATSVKRKGSSVGPRRNYTVLAKINPPAPENVERYAKVARRVGLPREDFEWFVDVGISLHEKQLIASVVALSCDIKNGPVEIGYGGAMSGGKSHWLLSQIARDCCRFKGLKCLLLRKVGSSNREAFGDLRQRVLAGIPHDYRENAGVLYFPNGSRIILGHFQHESDVDKYLGLEYDVIGVEEATTLSESKYRMIRTRNRTSKTGWRPRIYSTTNPGGIGHVWYKKKFIEPFRSGTETKTRFIPATIEDNPSINEENAEILDELDGWEKRAWRYGDWDIETGGYFDTFAPNKRLEGHGDKRFHWHVQPPFKIPVHDPRWRFIGGIDYGTTSPFCFLLAAISPRGIVYIIDEIYVTSEKLQSESTDKAYKDAAKGAEDRTDEAYAKLVRECIQKHGIPLNRVNISMDYASTFPPKAVKERRGTYPVEYFWRLKLRCFPAEKERVTGWRQVLNYLNTKIQFRVSDEDERIYGYRKRGNVCLSPMLVLFAGRCPHLERTIPLQMHDEKKPEDLNTDLEDHAVDALRYLIVQRPPAKQAIEGAKETPFDEKLLPEALRSK